MNKTNKLKRFSIWLLVNTLFYYLAYNALFLDNIGCGRVVKFLTWFNFIVCLMVIGDRDQISKLKEKGRPVNAVISGFLSALMISSMVYFGWFVTATIYLIMALLQHGMYKTESKDVT